MLLTGGAILTGGGLLTKAGIDLIPGLKQSIGYTPEAIARSEEFDLDNPDAYVDDFGDHARSWATGVPVSKVRAQARQNAIDAINKDLLADYGKVRQDYITLGLKPPEKSVFEYKDGPNKTQGESSKAAGYRRDAELARVEKLKLAKARGMDVSTLVTMSPAQIDYEISQDKRRVQREDEAEDRRLALKDREKIWARQDAKESRLRADTLREQMRRDAQTEANRAQEFQIQQMQLGLENRRLDMQEARNFRLDRQKAIMQIVEGMRSMGNAFAY